MTRKKRRLYLLGASLVLLGSAAALALFALREKIVFFYSPTQIVATAPEPGKIVRLGGLVEMGSLHRLEDGATVDFRVTDLKNTVSVHYKGVLPDLFREGQGVVVQGSRDAGGQFIAIEVLAKHDETYMPPEVAKALKESGRWQEKQGQSIEGTTP